MKWTSKCVLHVLLLSVLFSWATGAVMPEILHKEKYRHVYANVNETVTLPCKVRRASEKLTEKVLFYWMKDGIVLWRQPRLKKIANVHLEITKVRVSDTGYFSCHAHNNFGNDTAERILHVNGFPMPPRPSNSPSQSIPEQKRLTDQMFPPIFPSFAPPLMFRRRSIVRKGYAGGWIKLKCTTQSSARSFTFHWFKDGVPILPERSSRRILKARGRKLMVKQFSASDAGNYTCRVENSLGTANVTFVVEFHRTRPPVHTPPRIEVNLPVRRGENVTLSCLLPNSSNKVRLFWTTPNKPRQRSLQSARERDRSQFRNYRTIKVNGSTIRRYTLRNVSDEDSGDYNCYVGFKNRPQQTRKLKVVHLTIEEDSTLQPMVPSSRRTGTIPYLFIFPLVAGVLVIIIIFFIVKKHKQDAKHLQLSSRQRPALTPVDDIDEEEGSDFVLGPVPHGILRVHKPASHHLSNSSHQACEHSTYLNDSDRFFISEVYLQNVTRLNALEKPNGRSFVCLSDTQLDDSRNDLRAINCILRSSSSAEVTDPDDDRPYSDKPNKKIVDSNTWPKYNGRCRDSNRKFNCRSKFYDSRLLNDRTAKLPCPCVRRTTVDDDFVRHSECLKYRSWSISHLNLVGTRKKNSDSKKSKSRSVALADHFAAGITDELAPLNALTPSANMTCMYKSPFNSRVRKASSDRLSCYGDSPGEHPSPSSVNYSNSTELFNRTSCMECDDRHHDFVLVDDDGYCSPSSNMGDSSTLDKDGEKVSRDLVTTLVSASFVKQSLEYVGRARGEYCPLGPALVVGTVT